MRSGSSPSLAPCRSAAEPTCSSRLTSGSPRRARSSIFGRSPEAPTSRCIGMDPSRSARRHASPISRKITRIAAQFPALAQACDVVGTPALRHMGTLGGNLCQRPRCWYFRRGISCLKSGGSSCPAKDGENQYLAILDAGPCYAVHPSDPAVALTALEAIAIVSSSHGSRIVAMADLYLAAGRARRSRDDARAPTSSSRRSRSRPNRSAARSATTS